MQGTNSFNKTFLFGNVLNLVRVSQGINSIRMLSIKNKSQDEYSGFILDLIGCNQMKILHLGLTSIIEENND